MTKQNFAFRHQVAAPLSRVHTGTQRNARKRSTAPRAAARRCEHSQLNVVYYDCLYRSAPSRPQRTQLYATLMSGITHDYRDCIDDWTTRRSSCFFVTLNLRPSVERSLHRTDRGTAPSSISTWTMPRTQLMEHTTLPIDPLATGPVSWGTATPFVSTEVFCFVNCIEHDTHPSPREKNFWTWPLSAASVPYRDERV